MKSSTFTFLALLIVVMLSCDNVTDANGEDDSTSTDPPEETVTYNLSTSASPAEGGSISPSSGDFEENSEVSIEASPEAGFAFLEWQGDAEGGDNPLTITMESDKDITALFDDLRSEYSAGLSVSDGDDELHLAFGQGESPADSLQQAPPAPPGGAMHAWFESGDEQLFADFRDRVETNVSWDLHLQPGAGDSYIISWALDITRMEGILTLDSDILDEAVDMADTDSVEFTTDEPALFTISYSQ